MSKEFFLRRSVIFFLAFLAIISLCSIVVSPGHEHFLGNVKEINRAPEIGLPNPATVYCREMGYIWKKIKTEEGEEGICVFPDDSSCNAWDFYKGKCGKKFGYCRKQGYRQKISKDCAWTNQCTVCILSDGKEKEPLELILSKKKLKASPMKNLFSVYNKSPNKKFLKKETNKNLGDKTIGTPSSFDWRDKDGKNWLTPVRDQGYCGSCWAFGEVGVQEAQINIVNNYSTIDMDLSEQYLVSTCFPPADCSGLYSYDIGNLFDFIKNNGTVDENCYPYMAVNSPCSERCDTYSERLWDISTWGYVPENITEIKEYLKEKGPLWVGLYMSSNFDANNIMRCSDPEDESANHVVVLVGYNDTGQYWILRNSWGATWGPEGNGYFKVGYGECNVDRYIYGTYKDIVYVKGRDYLSDNITIYRPPFNAWLGSGTVEITLTINPYNLNYTNISIIQGNDVINSTVNSTNGTYTVNLSVSGGGKYNLSVTRYDLGGGSSSKTIPVNVDVENPSYSNVSHDASPPVIAGTIVNVSVLWKDDVELERAILKVNDIQKGSCDLSGNLSWCNLSIDTSMYGFTGYICWTQYGIDSAGRTNETEKQCFNVSQSPADILVVDDDEGDNYEQYYTSALSANGYHYNVYPVYKLGSPSMEILCEYPVVIWFTGNDCTSTLTSTDQSNLQNYLDSGGNLFISGQDIGWDINETSFYSDYLHAQYLRDDTEIFSLEGVVGDPIGDGLNIGISGGDGANNQAWPSEIAPADAYASSVFNYSGDGTGAIKADTGIYRVVYFAFGFEAINNSDDRKIVMDRVIDWFNITPQHNVRISSVSYFPYRPNVSDNVTFNVTVSNIGDYNESNLKVRLYVNGTEKDNLTIANLSAGQSTIVPLNWTITAEGQYTVNISVDPVTNETRVEDNYKTLHIFVGTASWTFMVYLDGDNNLEGAAIDDLNEMEMVGSSKGVNIIVQFDRIGGYDSSNGDWTGTRRYYVTQDNDTSIIHSSLVEDLGEVNMGDPDELANFVNWAIQNYPADNYALILWNHGSGWKLEAGEPNYIPWEERDIAPKHPIKKKERIKGVIYDDTSSDHLTIQEVEYSLSKSYNDTGKNMSIVGFDACLMQMIEVSYQIIDYSDFVVGSEETEPWDGWPYDPILMNLTANSTMSPYQLSKTIVTEYIESYGESSSGTQSAVNQSRMNELISAVDNFALALNSSVDPYKIDISLARDNTESYCPDYIDLYHFAENINSTIPNATVKAAAQAVMNNITDIVVAEEHGSGHPNSHGLTIYFPKSDDDYLSSYNQTKFANDTAWDEFLYHYYTYVPPLVKEGNTLLVDDDNGLGYETYYMEALDNSGYEYTYYPREFYGSPTIDILSEYSAVIWFTGDDSMDTLDSDDLNNLKQYLDAGGMLFISGQDIGYDLWYGTEDSKAFYKNYLHVNFISDDSNIYTLEGTGGPIGGSLSINIQGGDGASNQNWPSVISPADSKTTAVFNYTKYGQNYGAGAVKANISHHKVVYFAFGFEAINSSADRTEIMNRTLNWMGVEKAKEYDYVWDDIIECTIDSPVFYHDVSIYVDCNLIINADLELRNVNLTFNQPHLGKNDLTLQGGPSLDISNSRFMHSGSAYVEFYLYGNTTIDNTEIGNNIALLFDGNSVNLINNSVIRYSSEFRGNSTNTVQGSELHEETWIGENSTNTWIDSEMVTESFCSRLEDTTINKFINCNVNCINFKINRDGNVNVQNLDSNAYFTEENAISTPYGFSVNISNTHIEDLWLVVDSNATVFLANSEVGAWFSKHSNNTVVNSTLNEAVFTDYATVNITNCNLSYPDFRINSNVTISNSMLYSTTIEGSNNLNFTRPYSSIISLSLDSSASATVFGYLTLDNVSSWDSGATLNRFYPIYLQGPTGICIENVNISLRRDGIVVNSDRTDSSGYVNLNITFNRTSGYNPGYDYSIYAENYLMGNLNFTTSTAPDGIILTDDIPPNIAYTIQPKVVINGSSVSLSSNVTDNIKIGQNWAILIMPDGNSTEISLPKNFTVNQTGIYNITFFANDSAGNEVNISDYFISKEGMRFNSSSISYNNSGLNVTLRAYFDGSLVAWNQSIGNVVLTIANYTYDLQFATFNNSLIVLLRGVNLSENNFTGVQIGIFLEGVAWGVGKR